MYAFNLASMGGIRVPNLCHEHSPGRNLHVMPKLEILQKDDPLFHAYISINFEAYIGNRKSWVYIANNILCDHIQGWCLFAKEIIEYVSILIISFTDTNGTKTPSTVMKLYFWTMINDLLNYFQSKTKESI